MQGHHKIALLILLSSLSADISYAQVTTAKEDTTKPIKLNEAVITAHNEFIKASPNGFEVAIGGNIDIRGKETTDILKQLPTLHSNGNSLNMTGKSSVIVYINDREIPLDGQSLVDYLNSLPPDIIKSVEIMSTPPAKYDAEGNVGIINIVTKKHILPGWKGDVKGGYGLNTYSSYMGSAFASYTGKKFFFDGTLSCYDITYLNQSRYSSYYPDETVTTSNPKKWELASATADLSFGYDFSDKSTLILDFHVPLYDREKIADLENETKFIDASSGNLDSTLFSTGKSSKSAYTFNSGLYFKHKFNDKAYYIISANYLNDRARTERNFTSYSQAGDISSPREDYASSGQMNYNIATSKADFVFPLFSCTANAGAKLSFTNTASDNNFTGDIDASDKFTYEENVEALYFSMEKNLKKWSFKAGVRSEITRTFGISESTGERHDSSYVDFFPTVSISHSFGKSNILSLQYSDRIERPPYGYLDPFKWYISKYSYSVGNPFLKPSYMKNLELTYLHGDSFEAKIYCSSQKDKVGKLVVLDSTDCLSDVEIANNYLNVNCVGVNVYKSLKPASWYATVIQGDLVYQKYTSSEEEFENVSGFMGAVTMDNTFSIGDSFRITCNLTESFPGLYDYRTSKNGFQADIGLNYINDKSGIQVKLFVTDLFKTSSPEYTYNSDGVRQVYNNYYDSRSVELSLTWRFGNWYNKTRKSAPASNQEEQKRL
jgi:hypothetical protein